MYGMQDISISFFIFLKVLFDNTTTENMPDGYPKLETTGSKQTFIFRFRKFDESALYDPIVALGDTGSDDSGDDSGDNTSTDASMSYSDYSMNVIGKSGKFSFEQTKGKLSIVYLI